MWISNFFSNFLFHWFFSNLPSFERDPHMEPESIQVSINFLFNLTHFDVIPMQYCYQKLILSFLHFSSCLRTFRGAGKTTITATTTCTSSHCHLMLLAQLSRIFRGRLRRRSGITVGWQMPRGGPRRAASLSHLPVSPASTPVVKSETPPPTHENKESWWCMVVDFLQ